MATGKIVFASLSGNTETLAEVLAEKLTAAGVETEAVSVDDASASDFAGVDVAIVATYTYGDGDLPDEFEDFFEELASVDLEGKAYAVAGTGDTSYEFFAKSVDDFAEQFEKTGATKAADAIKFENDEINDDDVEAFVSAIASKL